jgi:hypothetical protein
MVAGEGREAWDGALSCAGSSVSVHYRTTQSGFVLHQTASLRSSVGRIAAPQPRSTGATESAEIFAMELLPPTASRSSASPSQKV